MDKRSIRPQVERPCSQCGRSMLSAGRSLAYCDDCRHPERRCVWCGTTFRAKTRRVWAACSPKCTAKYNGRNRAHGPASPTWRGIAAPYHTYEWHQRRDEARDRDGRRCQDCGRDQSQAIKLHAHHLVSRADWGDRPGHPDDLANLVTVCTGCHKKRHALPPDVLRENKRAQGRAYYLAHRAEKIAYATEYQKGYRARKRAASA